MRLMENVPLAIRDRGCIALKLPASSPSSSDERTSISSVYTPSRIRRARSNQFRTGLVTLLASQNEPPIASSNDKLVITSRMLRMSAVGLRRFLHRAAATPRERRSLPLKNGPADDRNPLCRPVRPCAAVLAPRVEAR